VVSERLRASDSVDTHGVRELGRSPRETPWTPTASTSSYSYTSGTPWTPTPRQQKLRDSVDTHGVRELLQLRGLLTTALEDSADA
jgi:hypothetical protein